MILLQVLSRERGRRRRLAKQTANADRMAAKVQIHKNIIKALVPPDQWPAIWAQIDEAERAAGLRK
jgi:hypothetical protein